MTNPVEALPANRIERHVLTRAGGMQGRLFDPNIKANPENQIRHEEVWGEDISFLFPGDERIRCKLYTGDLYIRSSRQRTGERVIRWSKPLDVENGIRMAGRVRELYDPKTGKEVVRIKDAIQLIKGLSQRFQKNIASSELDSVAKDAASQLAQLGFINTVSEEKQKITEQIIKAASRDVLSRINPARSRLILSHAWVDLIHELLVGKVTENKYASVAAKLIREREFERFLLSQVISRIDGVIMQGENFETPKNKRELKDFVNQYLSRYMIKLKPYSRVAAVSRFLILNTGSKQELDNLKKYIGEDANLYYGTKPFTKLTSKESTARLKGIRASMQEALELGELFLNTPTSERGKALQDYKEGVVVL